MYLSCHNTNVALIKASPPWFNDKIPECDKSILGLIPIHSCTCLLLIYVALN